MKKIFMTSVIALAVTSVMAAGGKSESNNSEKDPLQLDVTVCSSETSTADDGNGESTSVTCVRCATATTQAEATLISRVIAKICAKKALETIYAP